MSVFEDIHKFNKEVCKVDRSIPSPMTIDEARFLVDAVREEISEEFVPAFEQGNIPAQVDALIDAIYYIAGGLCRLGLTPEVQQQCFDVVHKANMNKANGVRDNRDTEVDTDAVKPEGWESPDAQIINIIGDVK